jgi:hypothetical protein
VPEASVENDVAILLAERDIRGVLARYCRGIDRGDYDLVRDYHSDAIDEHGDVRRRREPPRNKSIARSLSDYHIGHRRPH